MALLWLSQAVGKKMMFQTQSSSIDENVGEVSKVVGFFKIDVGINVDPKIIDLTNFNN